MPIKRAASMRLAAPTVPVNTRLSPQQQDVITWVREGRGSAFVEAVAGSGKTTTLVEACRHMGGSVALAAFNKKIADEIKGKVSDLRNVRVGTFHSFGFAAWRRLAPNPRVDADFKWKQMMEANGVEFRLRAAVGRMVSIAKQAVVGVDWDAEDEEVWREIIDHYDILLRVEEEQFGNEDRTVEEIIEKAYECVKWARQIGDKLIDFDDMLWLPLVNGAPVWENDWVLVDEAQDTNAARRMLASLMVKRGGRTLWVGDRHQAIYGFTGADADAVDLIHKAFNCAELSLTVTFRCSKAATTLAQTWVPHITPFESNAEGRVVRAPSSVFTKGMSIVDDEGAPVEVPPVKPGDAILCRNTKPLVTLAFQLIREGIGCHVEGRDIGKQLENLVNKWKVTELPAFITMLEAYRQRETLKLEARDAQYQVQALNDRIDTLYVIMEGCNTLDEVRQRINNLFKDSNGDAKYTVVLSTVHKAKGREWDRVFVLGYNEYMPSKWAKKDWERGQERNLLYVAATRTKGDLILTGA